MKGWVWYFLGVNIESPPPCVMLCSKFQQKNSWLLDLGERCLHLFKCLVSTKLIKPALLLPRSVPDFRPGLFKARTKLGKSSHQGVSLAVTSTNVDPQHIIWSFNRDPLAMPAEDIPRRRRRGNGESAAGVVLGRRWGRRPRHNTGGRGQAPCSHGNEASSLGVRFWRPRKCPVSIFGGNGAR